jgi:hypothetical protein
MSRFVSLNVDIEIDLSEINSDDLYNELTRRKGKERTIHFTELNIQFKDSKELLNHLKNCLGLREFHTKERIIKEIQEL